MSVVFNYTLSLVDTGKAKKTTIIIVFGQYCNAILEHLRIEHYDLQLWDEVLKKYSKDIGFVFNTIFNNWIMASKDTEVFCFTNIRLICSFLVSFGLKTNYSFTSLIKMHII